MIPTQLNEIAEFLKTNPYNLSQPLQDGRLNSSVNEEEILNTIKHSFPIQLPKAREWWDFSFEENDIFYPVNLKTTTTKTADNLNCKLGIYSALCGLLPTFNNEIAWEKYFQKLHKDLGKNTDRDYYFLIINKNDPKDIFINSLKKAVGIEIDPKICPKNALCMDFFDYPLENQFDTIIGNPPYVKHKDIAPSTKEKLHYSLFDERSNLYLFFIEKAIKHLKPKGELIFITPRDFLKSTSSVKLNELIYKEGTITHFFELGDQKVFLNAMPNCVIFRFCKGNFSRITNDCLQFMCKKGILYFLNQSYTQKLSEVFKVKVGAVSGCDKIFKNEKYGNLEFVTSITKRTNVLEKMVFVNEPNDYLLQHKDSLMQRKIKKFNENNWFEWGRMHHISPKKRIYVNTKTRQKNPFFIHQCPNYDGSILALFPYNQNLDLQNLCDKLNAINWQELGFVCDGRFLFSQRSLENALLPKDFLNLG
ncbi:class I SAM-dependent methyltransferase [Helicobacter pylori]|uniref:Eco57I restriction-modification methylase domain-containing protein n=1 Tax=Helicobacter pylori TaxID=210 RepID=UPI001E5FEBE6|nr:class I SAM-dependent methyltransferase [Helicobacter pylori]